MTSDEFFECLNMVLEQMVALLRCSSQVIVFLAVKGTALENNRLSCLSNNAPQRLNVRASALFAASELPQSLVFCVA